MSDWWESGHDDSDSLFTKNGEATLYELCLRHLEQKQARRLGGLAPNDRRPGWHASEMHSTCRRREVFKRVLPSAATGREWPADMLMRFQLGNAVHAKFQRELLAEMRVLKGTYRCSRCQVYRVHNTFMPDEPCPRCRWQMNPKNGDRALSSRASVDCRKHCTWPGGFDTVGRDCGSCRRGGSWHFEETTVYLESLDMTCRYDGILLKDYTEYLLEMKSIESFQFPKLHEPKERDVYQANWYMHAAKIPKALLVYVNKSSGEMKEFRVDFDPNIIDEGMAHVEDVERRLKDYVPGPRPCLSKSDPEAKRCAFRHVCFKSDDLDEIEELWRNRLRASEDVGQIKAEAKSALLSKLAGGKKEA